MTESEPKEISMLDGPVAHSQIVECSECYALVKCEHFYEHCEKMHKPYYVERD